MLFKFVKTFILSLAVYQSITNIILKINKKFESL